MTEGRLGKTIGKNFSKQEDQTQVQRLQEQLQEAQKQVVFLQDREILKDESYYRQQLLMLEERKAIALEEQAIALRNLSETPSEKEIEQDN